MREQTAGGAGTDVLPVIRRAHCGTARSPCGGGPECGAECGGVVLHLSEFSGPHRSRHRIRRFGIRQLHRIRELNSTRLGGDQRRPEHGECPRHDTGRSDNGGVDHAPALLRIGEPFHFLAEPGHRIGGEPLAFRRYDALGDGDHRCHLRPLDEPRAGELFGKVGHEYPLELGSDGQPVEHEHRGNTASGRARGEVETRSVGVAVSTCDEDAGVGDVEDLVAHRPTGSIDHVRWGRIDEHHTVRGRAQGVHHPAREPPPDAVEVGRQDRVSPCHGFERRRSTGPRLGKPPPGDRVDQRRLARSRHPDDCDDEVIVGLCDPGSQVLPDQTAGGVAEIDRGASGETQIEPLESGCDRSESLRRRSVVDHGVIVARSAGRTKGLTPRVCVIPPPYLAPMTTALCSLDTTGSEEPTAIRLDGDRVTIEELTVTDPDLAALLAPCSPEGRDDVVRRVLAVGARGLATMGIGIDVAAVDERMRQSMGWLTDEAERRLSAVLEQGREAMLAQFDPDQRTSALNRMLAEFIGWRDGFLGRIDPAMEGSHTTDFLTRLAAVVGPEGSLERRIAEALDPTADGSALASLVASVDARFGELRDLIVHQQGITAGRATEAERGTSQGLDFEDELETMLRSWAAGVGGAIVERVGRVPGELGAQSMVGDFVVVLADGYRVVIEAKNQAEIGLGGKDGILAELDRGMANRRADAAVCISRRDAFPAEVGRFGVYGTRVIAVDDSDGLMTSVALQWVRMRAAADASGRSHRMDVAVVSDRIAAIRRLADHLRSARSGLTEIRKNVDLMSERLGDVRTEILGLVADVERELAS